MSSSASKVFRFAFNCKSKVFCFHIFQVFKHLNVVVASMFLPFAHQHILTQVICLLFMSEETQIFHFIYDLLLQAFIAFLVDLDHILHELTVNGVRDVIIVMLIEFQWYYIVFLVNVPSLLKCRIEVNRLFLTVDVLDQE